MRGGWIGVAVVGICALLLAAPGAAQTEHWSDGDIQLVMANPSLQPQDDGAVHSGGDIMGQVFVRGNDSDRVAETAFSFGTGPSSPEHTPIYAGLQDFRNDDTPGDGWLLPITASDTPPGNYKFAIHAYESAGDPSSEIARMWGQAVLEANDVTPPWPWILPGETSQRSNPYGVDGVTIEFAENATATLWVDGRQVELEPWTPPARDNDNVPRQTIDEEREVLGSGYQWTGSVSEGTTLRVEATDEQGNSVTKGVLVGVGADAPVVELLAEPTSEELASGQGQPVHYGVTTTVTNWGAQPAEVQLTVDAPDPWTANVSPAQFTLEPGAQQSVHVDGEAPEGSAESTPPLNVQATYPAGPSEVTSSFSLGADRTVGGSGSGAGGTAGSGTNGSTASDGSTNDSPIGLVGPLAALAAGAVAASRRRRS